MRIHLGLGRRWRLDDRYWLGIDALVVALQRRHVVISSSSTRQSQPEDLRVEPPQINTVLDDGVLQLERFFVAPVPGPVAHPAFKHFG